MRTRSRRRRARGLTRHRDRAEPVQTRRHAGFGRRHRVMADRAHLRHRPRPAAAMRRAIAITMAIGGYRSPGPSYGRMPPFFPGTGDARGHLDGAPVGLTLYREAYIGRGLIYNTPPLVSAGAGSRPQRPLLSGDRARRPARHDIGAPKIREDVT